ncbi:hypothetical protein ES703_28924 [subsurface metagenome]
MKDRKKAAAGGIGGVIVVLALAASLGAKKAAEAPPERPIVGEEAKATLVVRHPEIPPEQAYTQLEVEPTSQQEIIESMAAQEPIVSPVIDIEETSENREAIETVEDTEEAKLMALPNGGQCTKTFLDENGNFYMCWNGYAVLTIRATEPPGELAAKKEEIRETGTVTKEPESWMEKELLEQERTGSTEVERNKMVYNYRIAHPGVSGSEAYKILFGSYLGR